MSHPRTDLDRAATVEPLRVDRLPERLLAESPTGVLACDEHGVLRSVNPACRRLLPGAAVGGVLRGPGMSVLAAADPSDGDVELDLADRVLTAHPVPLPGGWTGWYLSDVTEQRARLDNLLAERARSRFLARASTLLGRSLHPGRTARAVAELAAELADSAVVVLTPVMGAVEWFRSGGAPTETGWELVSRLPGSVRAALRGFTVTPAPLLPDELVGEPWTPDGPPAGAAVFPLPGDGDRSGALVLLGRIPTDGPDAAVLTEFAERAGIALTAAALYAQRSYTAEVLKRSILEPRLPAVEGICLGAGHRPAEAGLLIGGDFYDVRAAPHGGAELLIGDVCGKGVDAAVTATQIRLSVRALRRVQPDLVGVLEVLNDILLDATPVGTDPRFATVVLGTAHPRPGGGIRLLLAGGGHPLPVVVRPGGVQTVEIGGVLVGALHPPRFRAVTVDLEPGDACVLYTDGIVEARGGPDGRELFGEERLVELLDGCDILPAPGIVERILDRATRWVADRDHDDMAVLVIRAPPLTGSAAGRAHLRVVPT